jgi:hypothetical protein
MSYRRFVENIGTSRTTDEKSRPDDRNNGRNDGNITSFIIRYIDVASIPAGLAYRILQWLNISFRHWMRCWPMQFVVAPDSSRRHFSFLLLVRASTATVLQSVPQSNLGRVGPQNRFSRVL